MQRCKKFLWKKQELGLGITRRLSISAHYFRHVTSFGWALGTCLEMVIFMWVTDNEIVPEDHLKTVFKILFLYSFKITIFNWDEGINMYFE